MSGQKVYVPSFTYTRGRGTSDDACPRIIGAFVREADAVSAMLDRLIDEEVISYESYEDELATYKQELEENLYEEEKAQILRAISESGECADEKSFRIFLAQKVDGDFNKLNEVCDKFGCCFDEDYLMKIDEFIVQS